MNPAIQQKLTVIGVITGLIFALTMLAAIAFDAALDVGALMGIQMGLAISTIEEFYVQGKAGAWMRRIRPIVAIPIYAIALCFIFLMVQHLSYFVTDKMDRLDEAYARYQFTIPILFVAASIAILALRVVGFIGARNLFNLLIGRYMRPIIEKKVFLFLDMKGSTAAVEALGAVKSKAYIGKFLFDISRPVTENGGDIYLYTGDGLIGMWDWDNAIGGDKILRAIDSICGVINREHDEYKLSFGRVPEIRMGVHGGEVVISEQGDTKRAIGVYGDAINIAARMEQTAKELGALCILSKDIADHLSQATNELSPRGSVEVRGISAPIEVYSYEPATR